MTDLHLTDFVDARRIERGGGSLLGRLRRGLADWIAELCETPQADPTAHFSSREWADLPVHHPANEEVR